MSENHPNNYPKLHNAAWPGLVGKGPDADEPAIGLEEMLDMTAAAEVDGLKFDGFDIFLYHPHFDIDGGDDETRWLADLAQARNLQVGTVVAPIYEGTGGGSPMGDQAAQQRFLGQVHKACHVARLLRELGVRPNGVVRFDTGIDPGSWAENPDGNTNRIAETFRLACDIAEDHGERLAAEGEICWGGMHSWREMVKLLELVDRPATLGFMADMAHTLLYLLGYNAPEARILPEDFSWDDTAALQEGLKTLTASLRPWTIDVHIAQNDATVHGSGSHDKTGRHCLPNDPNGKLDIVRDSTFWLCDESGVPTRRMRHVCWDGCMFPNDVMMKPQTWNDILRAMIAVRDAHGWQE
ncbi:MAG TPA: TIM barrel protein [Thermoguttaceae bacterium]|nr:TIM barrel protein [Thermoguttaceae bacterium]